MTKARQIADSLYDQHLAPDDCGPVERLIALEEAIEQSDGKGSVRYEFSDGSAIVFSGAGWDVEGDTPYSWAGK